MNQKVGQSVPGGRSVAPESPAGSEHQPLRRRLAVAMMGPWRLTPILVALAVIWAFFASQSSIFLSSQNLTNLTNQIAVSSLVALGLVFLLLVRQIDISLASLAAVAGAVAADLSVEAPGTLWLPSQWPCLEDWQSG